MGATGSSQLEKEISTTESVNNANEHYYGLVNVSGIYRVYRV